MDSTSHSTLQKHPRSPSPSTSSIDVEKHYREKRARVEAADGLIGLAKSRSTIESLSRSLSCQCSFNENEGIDIFEKSKQLIYSLKLNLLLHDIFKPHHLSDMIFWVKITEVHQVLMIMV